MKKFIFIVALLIGGLIEAKLAAQVRSDYKIAADDIIVIDVFGEKDLSREFRVSKTGTINYFFLGQVTVAGKTTSEVQSELVSLLDADYLVEPQVVVDVKDYRVREVFVNGQVNRPGAILLTGDQDLTILGAIFRAGGLTTRASESKIKFTRPGTPEKVLSLDQLKNNQKLNVTLQSGDIIEIGDKLL
ncbi:MAG TPA: polysaccharide biosynthesis/export family protein [Pirellula sp.]|nr:polysaccharide biosynthesis/export family protein [Pirellula sp.]